MSTLSRAVLRLSPLLLAAALSPAQADLQTYTLDFESDWADLGANSFVQLNSLSPAPGGLHWAEGWFGQTTSPLLGSNNEARLGAGSTQVDLNGEAFYLESVDFRSMANGGAIRFDFVVRTLAGASTVYNMRVDGAPDGSQTLQFTTFSDMAALGALSSFAFGNFQGGGEGTDRNLFVMDRLVFRFDPSAVPEPGVATMLMLGLGLMGWLARRRT
jgi:hypothetical protein